MPEGLPSNRVLCLAEGPGEAGRTVLYKIEDQRMLYENDQRFLGQFR